VANVSNRNFLLCYLLTLTDSLQNCFAARQWMSYFILTMNNAHCKIFRCHTKNIEHNSVVCFSVIHWDIFCHGCIQWILTTASSRYLKHQHLNHTLHTLNPSNPVKIGHKTWFSNICQGSYRSSIVKFLTFPWLFKSRNDNFPDLIETITVSHKC